MKIKLQLQSIRSNRLIKLIKTKLIVVILFRIAKAKIFVRKFIDYLLKNLSVLIHRIYWLYIKNQNYKIWMINLFSLQVNYFLNRALDFFIIFLPVNGSAIAFWKNQVSRTDSFDMICQIFKPSLVQNNLI
jgi:hypothetical protein